MLKVFARTKTSAIFFNDFLTTILKAIYVTVSYSEILIVLYYTKNDDESALVNTKFEEKTLSDKNNYCKAIKNI